MLIAPMKAEPTDRMPEQEANYICEGKEDGWRVMAIVEEDGTIQLQSATGKQITSTPYITDALTELLPGTVLDGEIVDRHAQPGQTWNKAQSICSREQIHEPYANGDEDDHPLSFVIFDMPMCMGKDLTASSDDRATLTRRKELLHTMFDLMEVPEDVIVLIEELPCTTETLERILDEGHEGVVIKQRESYYYPGQRSPAWKKIKGTAEIEATCTGFYAATAGSKYEHKHVGGIEFHIDYPDGRTFDGRCGTGMKDGERQAWREDPNAYIGLVVEIAHWGELPSGALRHPSFRRFRDPADKATAEVTLVPFDERHHHMPLSGDKIIVPSVVSEPTPAKTEPLTNTEMNEILLERAITAEEERDHYKARCEDLEIRLNSTLSSIGGVPNGGRTDQGVNAHARGESSPHHGAGTRKTRRYGAMHDAKLLTCIRELEAESGAAYTDAVSHGRDIGRDLRQAKTAARKKGLIHHP